MARKKQTDQPDNSENDLIQKVDALMSVEGDTPTKPINEKSVEKLATNIKISDAAADDTPTVASAPALPPALRKKVDITVRNHDDAPESAAELPPTETAIDEAASDDEVETEAEQNETETATTDTDPLNDAAIDKAVDEIIAKEDGNEPVAEDAPSPTKKRLAASGSGGGIKQRLIKFFRSKRALALIPALLLLVLAIPNTRYPILGIFMKPTVQVMVLDSKSSSPVSDAVVTLAGAQTKTSADGVATLRASVGLQKLSITKDYYADSVTTYFVGLSGSRSTNVSVTATGRLVPVTVRNKVTGKPLANATITVLRTSAKTDARGVARIALPTKAALYNAKVTQNGFKSLDVQVTVTDDDIPANQFSVVPSGQVYFLSNAGGSIDVVKTDLDGSNRKVILEGTGKEDARSTSLLASRDWRYLVLKARRDTARPVLYLIDTTSDKVKQFDTSNADFTLVGWYDHHFIYKQDLQDKDPWQAASQTLKSYDADNQQINQLDQNQAEGDASSYAYQDFQNFYIVPSGIVYSTIWYGSYAYDLADKNATIRTVQANGQNKKDQQSISMNDVSWVQASLSEPDEVYFGFSPTQSAAKARYYAFANGTVKEDQLSQDDFTKSYPTYLFSPSGKQTFWSEYRDGKDTLFVGTASGENKQQIATASDYAPYGWYGNEYLLVTKGGSELFIMSIKGYTGANQPLKISNYYKPAQTFNGYGYGYGGL